MPTRRRTFSRDYKLEALRLADASGNLAEAARDLGVSPNLLYRWRQDFRDEGARAFPGNGVPHDEELARLRRENKRLHDELAIIKKALGIVSSPSR